MSEKLFERLQKDTKIVANARFNNSKRLAKKTWWSLFSISAISVALILLTICENSIGLKFVEPILFLDLSLPSWIFTTLSSIIVLALSIAISSARLDVLYEKMHDSAIRINRVSKLIEARKEAGQNDLYFTSLNEYQKVISENPINHEDIDFLIAKSEVNKNCGNRYKFRKYITQNLCLIPYYLITFISLSVIVSVLEKVVVRIC
ncbi:SLATT domain-containing protein [Vibrio parahaemolyticus]|nr:SLATT domain-containing protein [Vibrio parahaemolyticus]EGR0910683.1 SLATT domain-containing protein [Vibrio parahaemolyticus]EGR5930764.1 SLATT domain-containing protein [Vibrio parahaemolyticus]EGV3810475.1 SLATT domain-containing protein [Vibrio parahaemolyticus]EID0699488.1 SLATT domain-containing protein [Vibrio parahaemolyticus]